MLQSLKIWLLDWLDVPTRSEVNLARLNAIAHAEGLHKLVAPIAQSVVKAELDKDERTVVFNPSVSVNPSIEFTQVDQERLQQIVQDRVAEVIAQACKPGGILRK